VAEKIATKIKMANTGCWVYDMKGKKQLRGDSSIDPPAVLFSGIK